MTGNTIAILSDLPSISDIFSKNTQLIYLKKKKIKHKFFLYEPLDKAYIGVLHFSYFTYSAVNTKYISLIKLFLDSKKDCT